MDLTELHHHARRHGSWSMMISATQKLVCLYVNNGNRGDKWRYIYYLNDRKITEELADQLISAAFERVMA